jgi:hypothetical protein
MASNGPIASNGLIRRGFDRMDRGRRHRRLRVDGITIGSIVIATLGAIAVV